MPASEIYQYVGDSIWRRYLVFTVERDPLEKAVSLYFHRYKAEPRPPIEGFIESGEVRDAWNRPLYTVNGRFAADIIGNYARLDDFITSMQVRIGRKLPQLARAKSQFRPDRRPADQILTSAQINKVLEMFRGEPLAFGSSEMLTVERKWPC